MAPGALLGRGMLAAGTMPTAGGDLLRPLSGWLHQGSAAVCFPWPPKNHKDGIVQVSLPADGRLGPLSRRGYSEQGGPLPLGVTGSAVGMPLVAQGPQTMSEGARDCEGLAHPTPLLVQPKWTLRSLKGGPRQKLGRGPCSLAGGSVW